MLIMPMMRAPGASFALLRSYDFDAASSMGMTRTPGSNGDARIYTIHMRIKRTTISATQTILRSDTTNTDQILFSADNKLVIQVADNTKLQSTAAFTDTTNWHEWLFAYDFTLSSTNSIRVYYDGAEIAAWDTDVVPANADGNFNRAVLHRFGRSAAESFIDAKVADLHFISGAQLTPASFNAGGSPKKYTGSYGSGGLAGWITFADDTSTTTLCRDDAGGDQGDGTGSNDWTAASMNTANSSTDVPT